MTNPLHVIETEASEHELPRLHLILTHPVTLEQVTVSSEAIDYASIGSPSIAKRRAYHSLLDAGESYFANLAAQCQTRTVPMEG